MLGLKVIPWERGRVVENRYVLAELQGTSLGRKKEEECGRVVKAGFVSETCYSSHSLLEAHLRHCEVALIRTDRTIFDVPV
jgi:hypothetical protein